MSAPVIVKLPATVALLLSKIELAAVEVEFNIKFPLTVSIVLSLVIPIRTLSILAPLFPYNLPLIFKSCPTKRVFPTVIFSVNEIDPATVVEFKISTLLPAIAPNLRFPTEVSIVFGSVTAI